MNRALGIDQRIGFCMRTFLGQARARILSRNLHEGLFGIPEWCASTAQARAPTLTTMHRALRPSLIGRKRA